MNIGQSDEKYLECIRDDYIMFKKMNLLKHYTYVHLYGCENKNIKKITNDESVEKMLISTVSKRGQRNWNYSKFDFYAKNDKSDENCTYLYSYEKGEKYVENIIEIFIFIQENNKSIEIFHILRKKKTKWWKYYIK